MKDNPFSEDVFLRVIRISKIKKTLGLEISEMRKKKWSNFPREQDVSSKETELLLGF